MHREWMGRIVQQWTRKMCKSVRYISEHSQLFIAWLNTYERERREYDQLVKYTVVEQIIKSARNHVGQFDSQKVGRCWRWGVWENVFTNCLFKGWLPACVSLLISWLGTSNWTKLATYQLFLTTMLPKSKSTVVWWSWRCGIQLVWFWQLSSFHSYTDSAYSRSGGVRSFATFVLSRYRLVRSCHF